MHFYIRQFATLFATWIYYNNLGIIKNQLLLNLLFISPKVLCPNSKGEQAISHVQNMSPASK